METLSCSTIVYRAMARKQWIDEKRQVVLSHAFIRRPSPADDDGLSVDIVSPQSCASVLKTCYGVASLHVGRVRDLRLEIAVDGPPHANIVGIPRTTDDAARAEKLASDLARQARLIPPS